MQLGTSCFITRWDRQSDIATHRAATAAKKNGFKDIVPKGGRGFGPNPKICCMWNWDMRGVGSQTPICPNFKTDLMTKGDL